MLRPVFVVVILLAKLAAPVVLNPPGAVITPVDPLVKSPEFVITTFVADPMLLFTVKAVPVRDTPPTLVVTAPVKVVNTVPADCVMLAAVTAASAVTLAALTIVRSPRRTVPPTTPVK